jgi:ubiquinone/menaquinone biosynthesis C-methylase UbiE
VKGPGVDKVFDAGGPWPWPFNDDSIDRIDASHILEHVQDIDTCMKEAHRVLKIGGIFDIRVPFGPIGTQVNDELHHVHAFYTTSLNPYCQDNGANTSLDYKHQNALFKLESLEVTRIFWQRERLGKILGKWIEKPHTFPIGIPQEIHWLLRKVG